MTEKKDCDAAWQKDATAIARSFIMMFNGAMLYGCNHPNTAKNAETFCELLGGCFGEREMITIIANNGTFMIEDYPLDSSFNTKKIFTHFEKLNLISISFERGITADSIVRLVELAGNVNAVDACREGIEEAKKSGSIPRLRFNYVLYGKIRSDEIVIKDAPGVMQRITGAFDTAGMPPGPGGTGAFGRDAVNAMYAGTAGMPAGPGMTDAFNKDAVVMPYMPAPGMAGMPPAPGMTDAFNKDAVVMPYMPAPGMPGAHGASAIDGLAALSNMLGASSNTSAITTGNLSAAAAAQIEQTLTLASLLENPHGVSAALANAGSGGVPASGLLGALGSLKSEIDSTKTHSASELLESLFVLKQDLNEAIQVQKATGKVMSSAASLNSELDDLTCRAIVKLVRDEYKSGATPLNRLAHAIRRMLPNNADLVRLLPGLKGMLLDEGMSLGDYLELIRMLGLSLESETLSDTLKEAANSVGASVSDLVSAIRSKPEEAARLILLASEVRGTGEDASRLSDMLTGYIEEVSAKMAVAACGEDGVQDGKALKKVLARIETQMFGQLAGQGVSESVMLDIKSRLSSRFEEVFATASNEMLAALKSKRPAAANKIKLPPEALNSSNLLFLMNKELGRHARYKTPFTTALISVEKIIQNNTPRAPKPEDAPELLPQLFNTLESQLRDVDMIGTLDTEPIPELFSLLPMTGEDGAGIVKNKIAQKMSSSNFTLEGQQINLLTRISITMPTAETQSLKAYMALVRHNHKMC